MHINDLLPLITRVTAAAGALPNGVRKQVALGIQSGVKERLNALYVANIGTGVTTTAAVSSIEYTEALPVAESVCAELGIVDPEIVRLVQTYALAVAAYTLTITSFNAHEDVVAGGSEYPPAIVDGDVADITPEPLHTIDEFVRYEGEIGQLAKQQGLSETDFERVRVIYASVRAMMRAVDNGERDPIRGITTSRESSIINALDELVRRYKTQAR